MAAEAVAFRSLSLRASSGAEILRDITLSIAPGERVALLGRSGSGKTTLLRTINGMARPTGGRVAVEGRDVSDWDLLELRRHCGYVIQEGALFPNMTVERNTVLLLEAAGIGASERRTKARELLALVGLDAAAVAQRMPWELSGGQRQRVGVARALARDAPLLLMDEPFGALDPLTRRDMQRMLHEVLDKLDKTLVLVTHDLTEAMRLALRIVLLEEGSVVADLPLRAFSESAQPEVREYREAFEAKLELAR